MMIQKIFRYLPPILNFCFEGQEKSSNNASSSGLRGGRQRQTSAGLVALPVPSFAANQVRGISFERFPRLWTPILTEQFLSDHLQTLKEYPFKPDSSGRTKS